MERVSKIYDAPLLGILCDIMPFGNLRIAKLIILAAALFLGWGGPAIASSYTVDRIAEELLAAEEQYAQVRLEYVSRVRVGRRDDGNPNPQFRVAEVIYAQKMLQDPNKTQRLRYLDRKVTMIDPNAKETKLVNDILTSFDGEITITLDRMVREGEPMRGAIHEGYVPKFYSGIDRDPHTIIWNRIETHLKEKRDKFRIESESEVLDGVSTVKLAGTYFEDSNRGENCAMEIWVTPERGFLPLKMKVTCTRNDRFIAGSETVLSNLIQLPNGLWYPKMMRTGSANPEFAITYDISKISIGPIPEEFFRPEFPPNTHVVDYVCNVSYTTY